MLYYKTVVYINVVQIFSSAIDLRNGADPVIQHNDIYNGHRSGIVCLDSGKGVVRENDIRNNNESGVYILHRANPTIK